MCLSVYSIKHLDRYIWGGWWVSRSARWITVTAISPSSALFSASNVLAGALLVLVGNHSLKCPNRVSEGSFPHAPRVPCPTGGVCKCLTIDGRSALPAVTHLSDVKDLAPTGVDFEMIWAELQATKEKLENLASKVKEPKKAKKKEGGDNVALFAMACFFGYQVNNILRALM